MTAWLVVPTQKNGTVVDDGDATRYTVGRRRSVRREGSRVRRTMLNSRL